MQGNYTRVSPSLRDPDIRRRLRDLRDVERRVATMSLEKALDTTEELERGEVNVIFGKLLKQAQLPEVGLFREQMQQVQDHSESVPRRINELRRQLGIEQIPA